MSEKKQQPIARVSAGMVAAAIWKNASQGNKAFYNTTFELRFKDEQGEWHTGDSYGHLDLLALAKCADLAFNRIVELKAQDKEADAVKAA